MGYRRDIDGLRAIAVLPVILFHGGFSAFGGGFLGVDVFFVISGYLIAGILLRDLAAGRFSILGFYERRARRILPALFVVLLASLALALAWMPPLAFRDFGQSLVATGLFASNVLFWLEAGYFDGAAEAKPLLHSWSLAVEEQYYLLFPLALAALWRFGRAGTLAALGAVALASLIAAAWATRHWPDAAFYLTPFRLWELLAGALLALWLHARPAGPGNGWVAGAGLLAIAGSMLGFDSTTPLPALLPVAGTVAVIACAGPGTLAGRLLGSAPLVGIGLISYSAYLWHQPLFAFARIRSLYDPSPALMLGLVALTLALAWATWAWIEQPFRHRGKAPPRALPRRAPLLGAAVAGLALAIIAGGWGHLTDGRAKLWLAAQSPDQRALEQAILQAEVDHRAGADHPIDHGDCIFSDRALTPAFADRLRRCRAAHGPGLLILGDSHGIDTFQMAALSAGPEAPFIAGLVRGGCRPHDAASDCPYDAALALAAREPGLWRTVLFTQAGVYLFTPPEGMTDTRRAFEIAVSRPVAPLQPDLARIGRVLEYLEALNAHVPVIWLGPRLEPHVPLELMRREGCGTGLSLRPGQQAVFRMLDKTLEDITATRALPYISVQKRLDLHLPEDLLNCETVFWSDGYHFSAAGEARFAPRLKLLEGL